MVILLFYMSSPVVFVGPFEHHSNLLPWRESCAEVVVVSENASGGLNLEQLETRLRELSSRKLKIGVYDKRGCRPGVVYRFAIS